jgi:hypothetical protein
MSNLINTKTLKINGKEFKLKFNFRTMMVFEKNTNKKFLSFINSLASNKKEDANILDKVSAEDLAILFYAFLVGGGNEITKDEAIDMLDLNVFNQFMLLVPQLVAGETKTEENTSEKKAVKGGDSPLK